jgi:hypothetical protein
MAIIDRADWKIHPKVVEFWEKRGKIIQCYGDYWKYKEQIYGSAIYFQVKVPQISISSGDGNVIAKHDCESLPTTIYFLNDKIYTEEEILKVIKFIAFI